MRWLREPLLHFLLLGGVLFLVFRFVGGPKAGAPGANSNAGSAEREIVITPGLLENLAVSFERSHGRKPEAGDLEPAIDEFIREEIYCREARALGLDRDDPQVRRRLRQRMEFTAESAAPLTPPTDAELETFLRANPERFRDASSPTAPAPELAAIRERVLRAWEQQQRTIAIDAAYQKLRANYSVRRERPSVAPQSAAAEKTRAP